MKKNFIFCIIASVLCGVTGAFGAANVLVPKKAESVARRDASTSTTATGASLLTTAATLAGNVYALSQQQKALTAECEPTSREITFVNNMIKEWAIAGAINPLAGERNGLRACRKDESETYENTVTRAGMGVTVDPSGICYDTFTDADARGAVWAGFPKAVVVDYCADGVSLNMCSKNKRKKMTNMWTLFDMIDFDNRDYTRTEATQAVALLQKATNCSGTKLAAKRLETFGNFITGTIGNMGQTTNTGNIMDSVKGIVGQSGIGGVGSLANIATQFLDK